MLSEGYSNGRIMTTWYSTGGTTVLVQYCMGGETHCGRTARLKHVFFAPNRFLGPAPGSAKRIAPCHVRLCADLLMRRLWRIGREFSTSHMA